MLAKIAIGIVAIIGIALGALFFFYAVGPWIETRAIPMFGSRIYDTVLFGAAGLLCIFINLSPLSRARSGHGGLLWGPAYSYLG